MKIDNYLKKIDRAGHLKLMERFDLKTKVLFFAFYSELKEQGIEPDEVWIKQELREKDIN